MRTLLIAVQGEPQQEALARELHKDYIIETCGNGKDVLTLLQSKMPDVLILDLSLPYVDGLYILQQLGAVRPTVIIAITTSPSNCALQLAKDAGADMVIPKPCFPRVIAQHIAYALQYKESMPTAVDPQEQAARHMRILVIPEHRTGFQQLRVGLPLYVANPNISMTKELYPAIAELCGNENGEQVERTIRAVIKKGWNRRDHTVWEQYFPTQTKCPTNKEFFSNLARVLQTDIDF